VTDELARGERHQRERERAVLPQRVDQRGLRGLSEGRLVPGGDRRPVVRELLAEGEGGVAGVVVRRHRRVREVRGERTTGPGRRVTGT